MIWLTMPASYVWNYFFIVNHMENCTGCKIQDLLLVSIYQLKTCYTTNQDMWTHDSNLHLNHYVFIILSTTYLSLIDLNNVWGYSNLFIKIYILSSSNLNQSIWHDPIKTLKHLMRASTFSMFSSKMHSMLSVKQKFIMETGLKFIESLTEKCIPVEFDASQIGTFFLWENGRWVLQIIQYN